MSDIAAHLVDEVLPEAPVRQWVCALPWRLRYAMGYNRRLCSEVLAADLGGVNIHAGAAIHGRDRRRLERLCRYVARPPVSQERLSQAPDGRRLAYSFKRAWKNGSFAVVLDPLDLIARLAALIPPPRFHMGRYHGVLAAHANRSGWRPAGWPESA